MALFSATKEKNKPLFISALEKVGEAEVKASKFAFNLAKDIFHGITRSGASVGLELMGEKEHPVDPTASKLEQGVQKFLFGPEPLESISRRIELFPERAEEFGISRETSQPFAAPLVLGFTALDFIPGGGAGAKASIKTIAKLKDAGSIARLLKAMKVSDDLIPSLSKQLVNIDKAADVEKTISQAVKGASRVAEEAAVAKRVAQTGGGFRARAFRGAVEGEGDEQLGRFLSTDRGIATLYKGLKADKLGKPGKIISETVDFANPLRLPGDDALFEGASDIVPSIKPLVKKLSRGLSDEATDDTIVAIEKKIAEFAQKQGHDGVVWGQGETIIDLRKTRLPVRSHLKVSREFFREAKESAMQTLREAGRKLEPDEVLTAGSVRDYITDPAMQKRFEPILDMKVQFVDLPKKVRGQFGIGADGSKQIQLNLNIPESSLDNTFAEELIHAMQESKGRMLKRTTEVTEDLAKKGARALSGKEPLPFAGFEDLPIKTVKTAKEAPRGFIETAKEAPISKPELVRGVEKSAEATYRPITNVETLAGAEEFVARNFDEAIRRSRLPETAFTAEDNAIAQVTVAQLQNVGRYDEAIEIVENLAKKATEGGQAVQALALYQRLTPEGVLRFAQKLIDKANKKLLVKQKMTPKQAEELVRQAQRVQDITDPLKKDIEAAVLMREIAAVVPKSAGQYVSSIQTMLQLLNPKTAIRNIVGNVGFNVLENVKDVPAAALDSALSLFTGQRTKTLPSFAAQLKGAKQGFREGVRDALLGINSSGIATQFDLPKTAIFKGGVGKAAERLLNFELRVPDRMFYQAARDGSLYQQMKIAKVTKPTEEMIEVAHYEGLYRTFQDDNIVSKLFVGLKKALNVGRAFGIGDIVIKYPKTPANLLARGIEYSPAGFVNAIYQAARPLIGTKGSRPFNQRAFVESFSRALTGSTALVGTGALLHRLGIITGKPEKDIDISMIERTTGLGQYKINVSALKRFVLSGMNADAAKLQPGDSLWSYDWFQPNAIAISIGANIDEANGGDVESQAGTLLQSVAAGVDTLAEQPLVRGVTRLFQSRNLSDSFEKTIQQVPASFVPTLLNQFRQLLDNTSRDTYHPDAIHYAYNLARSRVPVLNQGLPERVGVFGETMETYQHGSNNLFNVFFNPAFISKYTPTPEAKMVIDLFQETGEVKQAPRVVQRRIKVNGEYVELSPTQKNLMQRYVGTITRDAFARLASSEEFQTMPSEDKVKILSGILTDVGSAGKIVILGDRPQRPSRDALNIVEAYLPLSKQIIEAQP